MMHASKSALRPVLKSKTHRKKHRREAATPWHSAPTLQAWPFELKPQTPALVQALWQSTAVPQVRPAGNSSVQKAPSSLQKFPPLQSLSVEHATLGAGSAERETKRA